MSSPRQRQLAEGIKNKLLAIQKSDQIYESLNKWERNTLTLDEKAIEDISYSIARNVEIYVKQFEQETGSQPDPNLIKGKIISELSNIGKWRK